MRPSRFTNKFLGVLVALALTCFLSAELFAQRGGRGGGGGGRGGGARPSVGRVGGGGSRPNMSRPSPSRGSMNRPSGGSRPNMNRPSSNRPSFGNAGGRPSPQRPSGGMASRPSTGGARPSLGGAGGRPNMSRPSTGQRPGGNTGIANRPSRPSVSNPSLNRPSTRPSLPSAGTRPGAGGAGTQRPDFSWDKPGGNRPSFGNTRPNRPDGIRPDRPDGIGPDRPDGIRPDRPDGIRPDRPDGIRPNRPDGIRPDRPVIGGGGNRFDFGNDTINIGNDANIGNQDGDRWVNRPSWDGDPGYSNPGWGIHDDWHNNWHDHCIHDHHNWYNGCWHGYWGSSWYAPVVWGGIGWGLGYGSSYYNPYYAEPAVAQAMPYDYSQPVVVNNYVSSDAQGGEAVGGESQAAAQPVAESPQALSTFDSGLAKFKAGDYLSALSDFNSCLKELPGDPVVHEVRALALFAVGKYSEAAASLNSLLSSAPGMDWTTMSGLYGNADDYTTQLRKLEQFCSSNPNDAPVHFVLAYHYLVTGSKDSAVAALQVVVKNQPRDATAKRMLDALVPSEATAAQAPAPAPAPTTGQPAAETDLVGTWSATAGSTKIELAITEDSQFTWTAKTEGQNDLKLNGTIAASSDGIALETSDQGTMAGTVTSKGKDAWVFAISGAPASDPGLSFSRMN